MRNTCFRHGIRAAAAGALLALLLPGIAEEETSRILNGPYLQGVGPEKITISWETDAKGNRGCVEYGPTRALGETSEREGEFTPCQTFIHHHTLTGLIPGTRYYYRVSSKGAASSILTFRTAPSGNSPCRFIVYGDSRSALGGYRTAHGKVVQAILKSSPPDILLHTGDFAECGELCQGWEPHLGWSSEFFAPAAPLLATVPLAVAIGNHDYYASPHPHLIIAPPTLYLTYFDPNGRKTTWYSFTYGCVRFIVVDSNFHISSGEFRQGSRQYRWLERELALKTPLWTVVVLHHPPFASRDANGTCAAVREILVPLFEKHRVPLVFAGHHHFYERSVKNGVTYITTAGGGAPLYADDRPDLNPYRVISSSVHHHCLVEATESDITVTARNNEGDTIDRIKISR